MQAEEYDCASERIRLIRFKEIEYGVQGDCFWKVATRLSSSAEPSQQVCSLQSAGLPSLVTTPFNRTTIPPIVVRLYTF